MKGKAITATIIALFLVGILASTAHAGVVMNYGDKTLQSNGATDAGHFDEVWDLTACDLVISFTYDANGLVDDAGHAWGELGVREVLQGDFNPNGYGIWLATDYDWTVNTFDPDPVGNPTLDLDDKLILQKQSGQGEGSYDLPSVPPVPGNNYGFWFDRDGVDQYQATYWGAVDGGTYNTAGMYTVVITLHATSATTGTAYMTVNGVSQGFYSAGWKNAQPEIYPAGMSFAGDMKQMQVFYGLYGYEAAQSVEFKNICVSGCLFHVEQVVPEVPLGAVVAGVSMFVAMGAYLGLHKRKMIP